MEGTANRSRFSPEVSGMRTRGDDTPVQSGEEHPCRAAAGKFLDRNKRQLMKSAAAFFVSFGKDGEGRVQAADLCREIRHGN